MTLADYTKLTPIMSGNTSGSITISASANYSSDFPWKAFDGNYPSSYWYTNSGAPAGGHWVQVDLGPGVTKRLGKVGLANLYVSGSTTSTKDWVVKGSNDGATWDDLASGQQPNNVSMVYYEFTTSKSYRYFRLCSVTGWYGANNTGLAELELYAVPDIVYDGTTDFQCSINVNNQSTRMFGMIEVSPTRFGRMTGKFNIIPVDDQDMQSFISVTWHDSFDANLHVLSDFAQEVVDGVIIYGNQRKSSLDVPYRSDFGGFIGIKPNGRMTGVVEIVEPPSTTVEFTPVRDAFVRESIPKLNYGQEQDMFVGRSPWNNERFRSLLYFPFSIPPNQAIKKAELVISPATENEFHQQIGVYGLDKDWTENGVTWDNQPQATQLYGTSDSGTTREPIRINLIDIVDRWYRGGDVNRGFVLKAIDEAIEGYTRYFTREYTISPPKLVVTYFDPIVYSLGRMDFPSSITVQDYGKKEITCSLFVNSKNVIDPGVAGSIYVPDPIQRPGTIVVSKPNLNSSIVVTVRDYRERPCSITVRVRGDRGDFPSLTTLMVSQPLIFGNMKVPWRQDITGDITVKQKTETGLGEPGDKCSIAVSRPEVPCSIYVRPRTNLDGSITVRRSSDPNDPHNMLFSSVTPSWPWIYNCSIRVRERNDFQCSISVREKNNYPPGIEPNSSITVRQSKTNEIDGSVDIIGGSKIPGSIFIIQNQVDNLGSSIKVEYASRFECSLIVNSGNLGGEIIVRRKEEPEIGGSIEVVHANMFWCSINVNSGFIRGQILIRREDWRDRPASLNVEYASRIGGSINVNSGNFPGRVVVRRSDESTLGECSLTVMRSGWSNLGNGPEDCSITVRQETKTEIGGWIIPRVRMADDLPTEIEVVYATRLPGSIEVTHAGRLPCSIFVNTQFKPYGFIL